MSAKTTATCAAIVAMALAGPAVPSETGRVEDALNNIAALHRPGQDGLATFWDGNKYVQCRRMPDQTLRCEAAGTLMQPSLARVLVPERIARLTSLGWQLDPSFGNYVQVFPSGLPVSDLAASILQALKEGYDADVTNLEVGSDWLKSQACPPRNGPSQNLAGMINDAPAMAATAVRGCSYKAADDPLPVIRTKADLLNLYRPRVAGEIQRLRVNMERQKFVYVVVDTGGGYVQCGTQPPRSIYCEAQSAESWPVLSRILTPDRVAHLYAAGYAEPGRAPNYWKSYSIDTFSDAALADELLMILYDAYGYNGTPKLEFKSEEG